MPGAPKQVKTLLDRSADCACLFSDDSALTTAALLRRLEHCTADQLQSLFDGSTADHQSDIIRHKLRAVQRRLAAEDYAGLAHLFRRNLRRAVDRTSVATACAGIGLLPTRT